jgi:hypothetical protein
VAATWKQTGQALGGALLLGACGCVGFWEEVTSREFEFNNLWTKPEPLVVLRDSTDYHRKGEALTRLREPLKHGGTQEQQDLYLQILARAAVNEGSGQAEPLSRDHIAGFAPFARWANIRIRARCRFSRKHTWNRIPSRRK